jgi:hypothetical protein
MPGVNTLTMIAVGVGVAPMIHALRSLVRDWEASVSASSGDSTVGDLGIGSEQDEDGVDDCPSSSSADMRVVLLYGVVRVCLHSYIMGSMQIRSIYGTFAADFYADLLIALSTFFTTPSVK